MPSWTTNRCARNPVSEVSARLDRYEPVLGAVQNERRHPDERQDVADVELLVHPQERLEHSRARAVAQIVEECVGLLRRELA